jgi:hypothetical protein
MTDTFIPQTLNSGTVGAGYMYLTGKIDGLHDRGVTYDGGLISFEYGVQPDLSDGQRIPSSDEVATFIDQETFFEILLDNLTSNTTYYYRLIAKPVKFVDHEFMSEVAKSEGFMNNLIDGGPLTTALNEPASRKSFFSSNTALESLWSSQTALNEISGNPTALRDLLSGPAATWLWDDPYGDRTPTFWDFFTDDGDGIILNIDFTDINILSFWYKGDDGRDCSICIDDDVVFTEDPPVDWTEHPGIDVSKYKGVKELRISFATYCISTTGLSRALDAPYGAGYSQRTCQGGYSSGRCMFWFGFKLYE